MSHGEGKIDLKELTPRTKHKLINEIDNELASFYQINQERSKSPNSSKDHSFMISNKVLFFHNDKIGLKKNKEEELVAAKIRREGLELQARTKNQIWLRKWEIFRS